MPVSELLGILDDAEKEKREFSAVVDGGSWGWPYKSRHKRPRSTPIAALVFSPVLLFFLNRQSRICSHMFALRFSAVLLGLEPPMFYLRKKKPSLTRRATVALSNSKGKWHKEGVLWAACTSRGGQYDWLPSTCPLIMFFDCFLA